MNGQESATEVRRAVTKLHRASGLPIAYGGPVTNGKILQLSELVGTTTDSLSGLAVHVGRGLGGRVLVLRRPSAVIDYQREAMISHEYDRPVRAEGVRSAIAVPIVVRGVTRAVIYGATREPVPLGDRAVSSAIAAARDLEHQLVVRDEVDRRIMLLEARRPSSVPTGAGIASLEAIREAHAELRVLAAETQDEQMRERVERACAALSGAASGGALQSSRVTLARRELDVLSCVALGHTNNEIANALGLLPETVKSYLRSAMRKLDCHTRMQAVVAARRAGLLP